MRTPVPTPARPHGTAKFTIEFDDSAAGTGYLFTNGIAPKGYVFAGVAWTGGEVVINAAPGGERSETFPPGRANWPAKIREARAAAGWDAEFDGGRITVMANHGHGTGTAEARFTSAETFLAAMEDAMAEAGWTLVTGPLPEVDVTEALLASGGALRNGAPASRRNDRQRLDEHTLPGGPHWPAGLVIQVYDDGRVKVAATDATVVVSSVRAATVVVPPARSGGAATTAESGQLVARFTALPEAEGEEG
jgi:hypothetical protein